MDILWYIKTMIDRYFIKDDWQRVSSGKKLHQKMNISEKEYREKQQSILENYKQSLLTKDQIYDTLARVLE